MSTNDQMDCVKQVLTPTAKQIGRVHDEKAQSWLRRGFTTKPSLVIEGVMKLTTEVFMPARGIFGLDEKV